ncbi:MAG: c-type cytochrome [Sphingopyxis sp.]
MSASPYARPMLLIGMAVALAAPSIAQTPPVLPIAPDRPSFEWPATLRNAQVLPADVGSAQLRATMVGFVAGLGVRCSYCHVGGEETPLSERDFASDANPKKAIARAMMRMTRQINTETLSAIPGLNQPRVTCYSCHRGAVTPLLLPGPPVRVPAPPPPLPPPAH